MNKSELITFHADRLLLSKVTAAREVKSVLESLRLATDSAAVMGGGLNLVGFGSFTIEQKAARKGRNPQTGAEIEIAAREVVKFKPSKNFLN